LARPDAAVDLRGLIFLSGSPHLTRRHRQSRVRPTTWAWHGPRSLTASPATTWCRPHVDD